MHIVFPPLNNLYKGIVRYMYDKEDFYNVSYSSMDPWWPDSIYPKAPLNIKGGYFQTWGESGLGFYSLSFKKPILLSHFSIISSISDNKAWAPPSNWSLSACFNGSCRRICSEPYQESLYKNYMQRFPVDIGIFDNISFRAYPKLKAYWTIQNIELNGFVCNNYRDCVVNLLYMRCTKRQTSHSRTFLAAVLLAALCVV